MNEPTDAELDELRQANSGRLNFVTLSEFRTIARAALAKWGTPPAVVGEPVAWLHDCAALLTNDVELWINACPHCGKPRTLPQPTQAQAGAVPLTDGQIRAMAREHPAEDLCVWSYRMGIDDAERRHGIKGGQHGTDTRSN